MQRTFIPGSNWLYLKIYTGIKTSDIILEEAIHPLIELFQKNGYISEWFFIRYYDPKSHLRIRLKINDLQYYHDILSTAQDIFQPYIDSGEIFTIMVDTYNREIERYGKNTIEEVEILFHKNSEFTLECLHYDDEEKIIVSLFYIDKMLNKLNLSIQEKLEWIKYFNHTFKQEFKADKKLNSQLDKKYREFKPKFVDFINSKEFLEERNFVIHTIEEKNTALQSILHKHKDQSLEMPLQFLFQSIFHMNINRIFVSQQRLFEMVIYDYLVRYYKTLAYESSL